MRLAVFGATGKFGRHVVEQALARGHQVTAFVRDPSKLPSSPESLKVVQGDVSDLSAVEKAVRGTEAVISVVSSGHGTLTQFTPNIIKAMERTGVSRIVSLVGAGVTDAADQPSIGRTFMLTLMRIVARHVLDDAENHATDLRRSDLDWTLVRPPRVTEGSMTGRIKHGVTLRLGPSAVVRRSDVASFMIDVAESGEYLHQSPMIAGA